jgi:hypothetical protein
MALALTIAGTDILRRVTEGTLEITNSGCRASGVMTFRAEAPTGTLSILAEHEAVFSDGAAILYGGLVKTVTPVSELCQQGKPAIPPDPEDEEDPGVPAEAGWRAYDVECQDYTVLATMDIIDAELGDFTGLTDKQIITAAFAAHGTKSIVVGTECQVLKTSVAQTAFLGRTLAEFMDELCRQTGGSWYVDYSRHLHYFITESEVAPFGISDTPDGVTTFGFDQLTYPEDSLELKNAVFYIPGTGGDAVATWYEDAASIAEVAARFGDDGRREASVRDDAITSQAVLDEFGAAFLTANGKKRAGSFVCYEPGLRGGMTFELTVADEGLDAEEFRIQSVVTSLQGADTPVFTVNYGDQAATLGSAVAGVATKAVSVLPQIDAAIASAIAADFASGITRVYIGNTLPTLPDALYPVGQLFVLTTDRKTYTSHGTAWSDELDGADLKANSILAGSLGVGAVQTEALAAGCVTAGKIDAGAVDFESLGNSAVDVISSSLPNNSFADATAGAITVGTSRDDAAGHTAALPYWTAWKPSGSGTATVTNDASYPGGKYVECRFSAVGSATGNAVCLTSDPFAVPSGGFVVPDLELAGYVAANSGLGYAVSILYYTAGGTYISKADGISAGWLSGEDAVSVARTWLLSVGTGDSALAVPASARYARFEIVLWEPDTQTHSASTYARLAAAVCPTSHQTEATNNLAVNSLFVGSVAEMPFARINGNGLWVSDSFAACDEVVGSQCFRTDLGEWYYYDGAQWVSTTIYESNLSQEVLSPAAANTTLGRGSLPASYYAIDVAWTCMHTGAPMSSKYWTFEALTQTAAAVETSRGTAATNGDTSGYWQAHTINIGAVLTAPAWRLTANKTSTPGTLYFNGPRLRYRKIAA